MKNDDEIENESNFKEISFSINDNLIENILKQEENINKYNENIINSINISSNNYEEISLYLFVHKIFSSFPSKEPEKLKQFNFNYLMNNINLNYFDINVIINEIKKINKTFDSSKSGTINIIIKNNEISENLLTNSSNDIILNYKLTKNALKSNGKFDILFKSYILYQLNNSNETLKKLALDLINLFSKQKFEIFSEKVYLEYVDKFTNYEKEGEFINIMKEDIFNRLIYFQKINDKISLFYLEKLLIQLLGNAIQLIRRQAAIYVNILYDEHNIQSLECFKPIVKYINENFEIEFDIKEDNFNAEDNYFLYVILPNQNEKSNDYLFTFISPLEIKDKKIKFKLNKFLKCGYYDFILQKLDKNENKIINLFNYKGRYIVQNNDIKDLNFHSLYIDLLNCTFDKNNTNIIHRGSFMDLKFKLTNYSIIGINALYLIGCLERDNYIDDNTSPFAITNRSKISSLLGGDDEFKQVMEKAKELKIKIFLDLLARISSSRYSKKYKNLNLNYLDETGKVQILYGCEGNSKTSDDNMLLNYRDIETWNLLISDALELIDNYKINGVQIDNAQYLPIIYNIDYDEMCREESENNRRYTNLEIINGNIVVPNVESGYWSAYEFSSFKGYSKIYPNPLLIKLTKTIWKKYPNFIFIGECNENHEKYINRQFILGKSGIIPHLYILPKILCSIYGKQLGELNLKDYLKGNNITDMLNNYYSYMSRHMPLNSLSMLSSGGDAWPYPALLFGRGNWPFITALFTLSDIPMTFMNEMEGQLKRFQITNVFEYIENNNYEKDKDVDSSIKSKSLGTIKRKENSGLTNITKSSSLTKLNDFLKSENEMNKLSDSIIKDIGNELSTIVYHYKHMRSLRNKHKSLKYGKIFFINNTKNDKVLSFCRVDIEDNEIAIININFGNTIADVILDLSVIKEEYKFLDVNTICKIENLDVDSDDDIENNQKNAASKTEYYFLFEILSKYNEHKITILPYSSNIFGISLVKEFNVDLYHQTLIESLSELCKNMKINQNNEYNCYDSYIISVQLEYILKNKLSLCEFAKWFNTIQTTLANYNLKYQDYFNKLRFITENSDNSIEYYKYIFKLNLLPANSFDSYPRIPLYSDVIQKSNKYGPICFITPELGRWSKVGGLGVMVDELTTCLSKLGQDIYVISPYYHVNRNGETDYLLNDKKGFIYLNSIIVNIDKQYSFDIYYGKVNGVKLYFMHNSEVFPSSYAEGDKAFTIREITLMGKASLELLCNIRVIPSLIVTNDWFTGLTVGYVKGGHFGEAFIHTTFFHICHNLEEAYEGRIYLDNANNNYNNIHHLNSDWVCDPYDRKVFNPSRCALLLSDQWGTVSYSYMQDLLEHSPLNGILKKYKKPFGYPNGIFKQNRINIIKEMIQKSYEKVNNTKINIENIDLFDIKLKHLCKEIIQKKYFKLDKLNDSIPVFSFIGRLTQQKGVLLILEVAEKIILNYNIQLLIGGMGNLKDPYCLKCINYINELKRKYPNNIWADPEEFFSDGTLINYGSDFGLMPSFFEPGGIVQHEFFIAGTPVLAFKTGGLKDSVFEFNFENHKGNGIIFDKYDGVNLYNAMGRAVQLYHSKEEFHICQKNAFHSSIDVMDVAKAWGTEFYRLKGKIFCDNNSINKEVLEFNKHLDENIKIFDAEINKYDERTYVFNDNNIEHIKNCQNELFSNRTKVPVTFIYYPEKGEKNKVVQISGSWDNWNEKKNLIFDSLNYRWKTMLYLTKGQKYLYKYILDNEWKTNPQESLNKQGNIINNEVDLIFKSS